METEDQNQEAQTENEKEQAAANSEQAAANQDTSPEGTDTPADETPQGEPTATNTQPDTEGEPPLVDETPAAEPTAETPQSTENNDSAPGTPAENDDDSPERKEYLADKEAFHEKYVKYQSLSPEEQDSPDGKALSDELSVLHEKIQKAEATPGTTDDNLEEGTTEERLTAKLAEYNGLSAEEKATEDGINLRNEIDALQSQLNDDAPEGHVDHPDDYKSQVKLSDAPGDFVPKQTATKLVKASMINEHFKDVMLQQISDGQLKPPYVETYHWIKSASDNGTAYRPGQDGL